jgi:hypothetical protein
MEQKVCGNNGWQVQQIQFAAGQGLCNWLRQSQLQLPAMAMTQFTATQFVDCTMSLVTVVNA